MYGPADRLMVAVGCKGACSWASHEKCTCYLRWAGRRTGRSVSLSTVAESSGSKQITCYRPSEIISCLHNPRPIIIVVRSYVHIRLDRAGSTSTASAYMFVESVLLTVHSNNLDAVLDETRAHGRYVVPTMRTSLYEGKDN